LSCEKAGNSSEAKSNWFQALNHCQRAKYDAVVAGLDVQLGIFRTIYNSWDDIRFSDFLEDFSGHQAIVQEAKDFLIRGEKHNGTYFEDGAGLFERLEARNVKMAATRPDFQRERFRIRRNYFWMVIGGLGAIIALIALAGSIGHWW
jgi:hypothetical protein